MKNIIVAFAVLSFIFCGEAMSAPPRRRPATPRYGYRAKQNSILTSQMRAYLAMERANAMAGGRGNIR